MPHQPSSECPRTAPHCILKDRLISDEVRAWVGDAGRRAADRAPRILPGTDVAIELQRLFSDWPEVMRQVREEAAEAARNGCRGLHPEGGSCTATES